MIESDDRASELQLVQKAQQGESAALSQLLDQHKRIVHTLAYRVDTWNELHDDLVQAGCIGLMEAISRYNPDNNVRLITYAVPWMIGEMKRTIRSNRSKNQLSLSEEALISNMEEETGNHDELCIINRIDLKTAYDTLDEEERKILLLRYSRGKTQKETAHLLKKSQGQISKAENRILDSLRRQLS